MKKINEPSKNNAANETSAAKMMACMKAVDHNEKIIERYQRKIDSLKKLNDKHLAEFMSIVNDKYSASK